MALNQIKTGEVVLKRGRKTVFLPRFRAPNTTGIGKVCVPLWDKYA